MWMSAKRTILYSYLAFNIYIYIKILFNANYLTIIYLLYFLYNCKIFIFIYLYLYLFFNCFINSIFFNKLLVDIPLRHINCAHPMDLDLIDGAILSEASWSNFTFIETYMSMPEDTSVYPISVYLGNETYKNRCAWWHTLDTQLIFVRFSFPFSWVKYKTYSYDAYEVSWLYYICIRIEQLYYCIVELTLVGGTWAAKTLFIDPDYEGDLKIKK